MYWFLNYSAEIQDPLIFPVGRVRILADWHSVACLHCSQSNFNIKHGVTHYCLEGFWLWWKRRFRGLVPLGYTVKLCAREPVLIIGVNKQGFKNGNCFTPAMLSVCKEALGTAPVSPFQMFQAREWGSWCWFNAFSWIQIAKYYLINHCGLKQANTCSTFRFNREWIRRKNGSLMRACILVCKIWFYRQCWWVFWLSSPHLMQKSCHSQRLHRLWSNPAISLGLEE